MIGNKDKFISLITMNDGKVTFKDNAKWKVVGNGKVGRLPNCFIDYYVTSWRLKTQFN